MIWRCRCRLQTVCLGQRAKPRVSRRWPSSIEKAVWLTDPGSNRFFYFPEPDDIGEQGTVILSSLGFHLKERLGEGDNELWEYLEVERSRENCGRVDRASHDQEAANSRRSLTGDWRYQLQFMGHWYNQWSCWSTARDPWDGICQPADLGAACP